MLKKGNLSKRPQPLDKHILVMDQEGLPLGKIIAMSLLHICLQLLVTIAVKKDI